MQRLLMIMAAVLLLANVSWSWVEPTYTAPEMPAITVDGDLSEWAGATWQDMDQIYDSFPDVTSARWAVGWDYAAQKLYFAAEIVEEAAAGNFVLGDAPASWNTEDHLEIYVHGDRDGKYDNYVGAQQYLVCAAGLSADGQTYNGYLYWGDLVNAVGDPNDPYPNPDVQIVGVVDGTTMRFEGVITVWVSNDTDPLHLNGGKEIGFDVVYTDVDDWGGTVIYSGMLCANTATGKFQNPAQFARLILSGTERPECGYGQWAYRSADLNQDCYVDWADFGIFASHWLECTDPGPPCNYQP